MQNTLYTCPTPLQASLPSSHICNLKSTKENQGYFNSIFRLKTCGCLVSLQEAVAQGMLVNLDLMGQPECYFSSLAEELEGKRDRMAAIVQEAGMTPVIPEGGYFMLVDVTSLSELLNI